MYKILHIGLCAYPDGNGSIQRAFKEIASEYKDVYTGDHSVNAKAVQIANEMKPDIVFMQIQQGGVIQHETLRKIKQTGAFIINWNGDVRNGLPPWMLSMAPFVDITAFSNMRDVSEMRSYGQNAEWLEIGYDETIYCQEGEVKQGMRPIVFFANNSSQFPMSAFRVQIANYMRLKFPNDFGLYGNGPNTNGNFNHSQHDEASAYRGTRIAINCSHYEIEKYTSDRMLRILGTGTPICLAKWYPGIEEFYKNGEQVRIWSNLQELEALCRYYMSPANEEERKRIVKGGHDFV